MFIQKIGVISHTYRHMHRYSEILAVLIKFGFGDLISGLKIEQYLDIGRNIFIKRESREKVESLSRAERLRLALEELGPTFIKLGQALSTRADLLPPEFIRELVKLQDNVAPFAFSEAEKVLEAELKGSASALFQSIEPVPLAAASIGQVHKAKLTEGEEVVIKIQRPGIRRVIEVDLEILYHLATLVEKHLSGWEIHRPTRIVEEFGRMLARELDYTIEAASMERFAAQFLRDPRIYVPKVFREATTVRILTMEYIEGIKASSVDVLRRSNHDLKEIATRGAELVMTQIFVNGFFHADPHPGNLLILPGDVICFLDMGMMGRLDRNTRERIIDLVTATVRRDESTLATALIRLTDWDDEPDRHELERDAMELVERHLYRPLKDMPLVKFIYQIFEVASKHRLRLPMDVLFLIKALGAIEGVGRDLDPEFNLVGSAAPFVERAHAERFHPRRVAEDMLAQGGEMMHLLKEIPLELRQVLRLARQGRLRVDIQNVTQEQIVRNLDRTGTRLSFAIVLAALIVGSSLMVLSDIPPKWYDIPLIGLAGYLLAGIMGFWLLISTLRKGKL
ncbi:MAG: AarF/ABC1/UbiB kinase family protein [Desulfobacteraceae bacterium]|nr:MAG: AarF/ABC1/UbiB kinase family protein [Desulfobacteraceae bacterium]